MIKLTKLLNKLFEICTFSSLDVNLSKTKILIFGRNKRKLDQEAFYLGKDQIEITHEYKYFKINFYSHGHFEPSSKRCRIVGLKALMSTLRKDVVVGNLHVESSNHIYSKALVLPTFT